MISEKEVRHLAGLARIKLTDEEEKNLSRDLGEILEYFKMLQEVDTEHVEPCTGGTMLAGIVRDDTDAALRVPNEDARAAFPESDGGFLKVPPVFQ